VWLLARARSSLTLFEHVALLVMLAGGLEAIRSIVWFALAAVVVLPRAVDAVWPQRELRPGLAVRSLARVCALALPGVVVLLLMVPASAYENEWPTRALAAVRAHPGERVLADDRYADWLLWNVPSLRGRLAYDVRFEVLTTRQLRAIAGFRAHPSRLARGYGIVVLEGNAAPVLGGRTLYADGEITVLER